MVAANVQMSIVGNESIAPRAHDNAVVHKIEQLCVAFVLQAHNSDNKVLHLRWPKYRCATARVVRAYSSSCDFKLQWSRKSCTSIAQLLRSLCTVRAMLISNDYATKRLNRVFVCDEMRRDIYYNHKQLYVTQRLADRALTNICTLLGESRLALHVVCTCARSLSCPAHSDVVGEGRHSW
jgi:hypothetical protein